MLADFETAPIDEKLRAVLGLLKKMTLTPDELTPADMQAVRDAGVSDEAIRRALYICYLLNVSNRISNTLAFQTYPDYSLAATMLLHIGYR